MTAALERWAHLVMACVLRSRALWPVTIERGERACVLLTAIALQESDGRWRTQQPSGPARSWWQIEPIAVRDVLRRARSIVAVALDRHGLRAADAETIHEELGHPARDDLAACIARAILWLVPVPLPETSREEATWAYYLRAWRPGKPRPERWPDRLKAARAAWRRLADPSA